jgi:hypothetical protein
MREVTQFVVVFPDRMVRAGAEEKARLVDALRRQYPHYEFQVYPHRDLSDDEDFRVFPIMGRVGDAPDDDPDRVYMCRPLDPKVIPELVCVLVASEAAGAAMH